MDMEKPTAEQLTRMRRFNEKVDHLKKSQFAKSMFGAKTGVTLTWNQEGGSIEFRGPQDETVEAMVLTLRFLFTTGRDQISIYQMEELVRELPGTHAAKTNFLRGVEGISQQLAKPAMPHLLGFKVDPETGKHEAPLTNHGILEHVIYGEKAHTNPDKEDRVKFMRQSPETSALLDLAFNSAAIDLLRGLFFLQHHNAILFEHFTGEQLPVHNRGKG